MRRKGIRIACFPSLLFPARVRRAEGERRREEGAERGAIGEGVLRAFCQPLD